MILYLIGSALIGFVVSCLIASTALALAVIFLCVTVWFMLCNAAGMLD